LAAEDAGAKVVLLESELVFNETLVEVVEQMKRISAQLEAAQDSAVQSQVVAALDRLEEVEAVMGTLGTFRDTRVVGLLQSRSNSLRAAIVENTTECWNALLVTDPVARRVMIGDKIQRLWSRDLALNGANLWLGETPISIDIVVEALTKLRLFDTAVSRFSRDFENAIISPRLSITVDPGVLAIVIDGDDIQAVGHVEKMTVHSALEDIHRIAEYLSTRLPPSIAIPLSGKLVPALASRLINNWLLPAVPLSLGGIEDFHEILALVLGLAEYLDDLSWTGQSHLVDWVDKSAEIWVTKRKEATIAEVRRLCFRGVKSTHVVERVETQTVTKSDNIITSNEAPDDDWGADWGEDDTPAEEPPAAEHVEQVEEEDLSAWGADDDEEEHPKPESKEPAEAGEDEADAWGWGDEDDSQAPPTDATPKITIPSKTNGALQQQPASREITLKETYTVTSIPDSILEIINQVIYDVDALNQPP
jgi:centromere/kinetochore protein ZW10